MIKQYLQDGLRAIKSHAVQGIATAIVGLAAVLGTLPAAAAPMQRNCAAHAVYGDIGARYAQLGGPDGILGCPISDEADTPGKDGRFNRFENGMITWSGGRTGDHPTYVAYQVNNSIVILWGSTAPFNYDTFLVRWDVNGRNEGQEDVWAPWAVFGGSNWKRYNGQFTLSNVKIGQNYSILIKGCDYSMVSGHTCRQGWSSPLWITPR